jgi:futalosine hydrolase
MKFLVILSSVSFESDVILSQMKGVRRKKVAGKFLFTGKIEEDNVLLINAGIGKVNAAHSATAVIENFPVSYMVNIGIGGAYSKSGLLTGDIAVASREIYGDDGVITSKGWRGMKETGIPVLKTGNKSYFNEYPLDINLSKKALTYAKTVSNSQRGNFVTLSATSGTQKRALELEKRFKAICENMEGAAVAHICSIYNIPFLEIRGISNVAGIRDRRRWDLKLASENCQKAALNILNHL